jgi:glycosyltransferase involved in cell wall biosynthesis
MRILFTRFPLESAFGGAEVQLLSLMRGLHDKDHDVEFLGSCPVLLAEVPKLGIPAHRLDIGPPPVTKLGAITFAWRRRRMKREILKRLTNDHFPPDAVVMASLTEKILLSQWLFEREINVFWIEHDRVGTWLKRNPWLPQLRRAAQYATIVCVSELSRGIFIGLGFDPRKIIVIPNGIDTQKFAMPEVQRSASTSGIHIGCIARLSEEKGVDLLLHAIADMPEITLSLVGTGRDEGLIRTIITENEHREGVSRVSLSRSVDVREFFASIDALVLPSRDNDPFGLVVAEAMSAGVPVLVTEACGIAAYLQDNVDALVVPADDALALADGIAHLLSPETRKRLSTEGAKTAREKFSSQRMIDEYEKVINPR